MKEETLEQRISHLEHQFEQLAEAFHSNSQVMVMLATELKYLSHALSDEDPMGMQ